MPHRSAQTTKYKAQKLSKWTYAAHQDGRDQDALCHGAVGLEYAPCAVAVL
jgi:hypothetical protein